MNRNPICLLVALAAAWPFASAGVARLATATQVDIPYNAFVLRDGVSVRSGPGAEHYATDELTQGVVVEVWRHDPGGWCAVRPPDDSFSLVPQSAVDAVVDGRTSVVIDGVQAWVGTRLGPVDQPLWQIKLKQGEQLTVLGEVSWPDPDGHSTLWYQISPPDGEFRWIHRDDLQFPDPRTRLPQSTSVGDSVESRTGTSADDFPMQENQTGRTLADSVRLVGQIDDRRNATEAIRDHTIVDPFGDEEAAGQSRDEFAASRGWRRAKNPIRLAQAEQDHLTNAAKFTPDGSGSPPLANPIRSIPDGDVITTGANGYSGGIGDPLARNVVPTVGGESMSDRLRQIDMELSLEIVKPAQEWKLDRISQQLVDAYQNAATEQERNHARQLVAKVDRLRGLQFNLGGRGSPYGMAGTQAVASAPTGSGIAPSVQYGTTYDAFGWLNECVQDAGRAPSTYVLQDDNGKIICQITPSPGLNLHRYLRSKIGVIGQRGFNQKFKLNHVTADRIVVLEKLDSNLR